MAIPDIESQVCEMILSRQALGIRKYGKTVAENPLSLREWLLHGAEEALDQAIYARRAIAEINAREGAILQSLAAIEGRFTSLNKIPVEKASVPREEWLALRRAVLGLLHGGAQ